MYLPDEVLKSPLRNPFDFPPPKSVYVGWGLIAGKEAIPMEIARTVEGFEAHLRANGCSIHTVRSYLHDLRLLARWLRRTRGPSLVERITPHHLDRFLTSEEALFTSTGHSRGPGALGRMRAVLRSFFRWLESTGQIRFNPAASLRVGRYSPPVPQTLSPSNEKALLAAMAAENSPATVRDRAMVALLLGTGMRISEAVGLDLGDIDLRSRTVTILTKGGHHQARHLSKNALRYLRPYLRWRKRRSTDSPALFLNNRGGHIGVRHVQRRLSQWALKAGLNSRLHPHALRHTLATRLLEKTSTFALSRLPWGTGVSPPP